MQIDRAGKGGRFCPILTLSTWDTTGAGHIPHVALVLWWDRTGPPLCSPALHRCSHVPAKGRAALRVWEVRSVAGSKHFRLEMFWGRGRSGLGSGGWGDALPCTPHTPRLFPSSAVAANPWHTRENTPHPSLELLAQLLSCQMTGISTQRQGPGKPKVI